MNRMNRMNRLNRLKNTITNWFDKETVQYVKKLLTPIQINTEEFGDAWSSIDRSDTSLSLDSISNHTKKHTTLRTWAANLQKLISEYSNSCMNAIDPIGDLPFSIHTEREARASLLEHLNQCPQNKLFSKSIQDYKLSLTSFYNKFIRGKHSVGITTQNR